MADQTQTFPSFADKFKDSIFPSPAGTASGKAFQEGTAKLSSINSIDLDSPASTGFAAANQGPTGGGFNPQTGQPTNTNTGIVSGGSNDTLINPSVGNTTSNTIALGAQMATPQGVMGNMQGGSGQAQQQSTGLPSGIVDQAISKVFGNTFSGIKSSINDFGSSLGFSSGVNLNPAVLSQGFGEGAAELAQGFGSDAIGAASAGNMGGLTLSGALGAAGLGFAGGSLLAGLTGGNQLGGGIGGAVGATAGAAIGSVIPGVGTIIGGLVGGIGGSLFGGMFGGNKTPTSASEFATNKINPNGVLDSRYASKNNNSGFAQQESKELSTLFQSASSNLGINFAPLQGGIGGGYNSLYSGDKSNPSWISVGKDKFLFNPSDSSSVSTAYFNALNTAATQSGYKDTQALHDWYYGQPSNLGANPSAALSGYNASPISIAPRR